MFHVVSELFQRLKLRWWVARRGWDREMSRITPQMSLDMSGSRLT